ncbi:hypothetical protein BH24ACI3_BH24ACI3_05490 [soil metagenome]
MTLSDLDFASPCILGFLTSNGVSQPTKSPSQARSVFQRHFDCGLPKREEGYNAPHFATRFGCANAKKLGRIIFYTVAVAFEVSLSEAFRNILLNSGQERRGYAGLTL